MKTIKNDILSSLAAFLAVIGSLAFVFFWIRGTIIIAVGGQDLFAAVIWIVFITCMLYFMSLLTSRALITSNIPLIQKVTLLAIDIVAVGLTCFFICNVCQSNCFYCRRNLISDRLHYGI